MDVKERIRISMILEEMHRYKNEAQKAGLKDSSEFRLESKKENNNTYSMNGGLLEE